MSPGIGKKYQIGETWRMSWLALRRFPKNLGTTIFLKFKVLSHFDLMETCQDIAERQQHHHAAWIQILLFVLSWPRWAVF